MGDIKINTEFLPERCEICHQTDCFDAERNWCERCSQSHIKELLSRPADLARRQPGPIGRVLCAMGAHKWHYLRWDRYCERCSTIQHVWRIMNRHVEYIDENEQLESGISPETLTLPLRKWQCNSCMRNVMSVHPPGYFERCPFCGKTGYIERKLSIAGNKG